MSSNAKAALIRPTLLILLTLAPALIPLAGCASAEMVSAWQNPESQSRDYRSLLIVGITQREDVRRLFEDDFTANLAAAGARATPSYTLVPAAAPTAIDKEQLRKAADACRADAVLITRLVKRENRTQVSAGPTAPPVTYGSYYGYYHTAWDTSYSPPVVTTTEVVTTETRLYDTKREQLVWVGTTESFDPSNMQKDLHDLVKSIARDLRQRKLI